MLIDGGWRVEKHQTFGYSGDINWKKEVRTESKWGYNGNKNPPMDGNLP